MAYPDTTGLTKTELDQSSDDPSQARAELEALYDKVVAMLNNTGTGNEYVLKLDASGNIPSGVHAAGDFGIGTTPSTPLDVDGTLRIREATSARFDLQATSSATTFRTIGPYPQIFKTSDTERMSVSSDGGVYSLNATGGSQGADTINFSNYYRDGELLRAPNILSVGDSTTFDIDANIGASFESVGPTGSGATNIWTALDQVPTSADWVLVKIYATADDAVGNWATHVYARPNGNATGAGHQTRIAYVNGDASDDGNLTEAHISIDSSNIFDLYYSNNASITDTCTMILFGWGWN